MKKLKTSSFWALTGLLFVSATFFAAPQALAKATPWPSFATVDDRTVEKNKIEIANMPRVLAQHEFGICHSMAATTLAQWYMCKGNQIADCANLAPDQEISVLSMLGWARPNTQICKIENGKYFSELGAELPQNYCGPKLGGSIVSSFSNIGLFEGASASGLMNSSRAFNFKTEACFQSEKLLSKHGKTPADVAAFDKAIKTLYQVNKSKTETCPSCLQSLASEANRLLDTDLITADTAKSALEKSTSQEFLYALVFRDCKGISITRRPNVKIYPDTYYLAGDRDARTTADISWKIDQVLKTDRPLILSDICIERNSSGTCEVSHVLIVSGSKELCDTSGLKCKRVLKLQNSWGTKWHKDYGVWFDEATLLASINQTPDALFHRGILSWYE